jgi:hypothetical protein
LHLSADSGILFGVEELVFLGMFHFSTDCAFFYTLLYLPYYGSKDFEMY